MTLTVDARFPTGHSIERVAFSADAIRDRVGELGREITDAYAQDERLIVIGLLKGSFLSSLTWFARFGCPFRWIFSSLRATGRAWSRAGMYSCSTTRHRRFSIGPSCLSRISSTAERHSRRSFLVYKRETRRALRSVRFFTNDSRRSVSNHVGWASMHPTTS